MKKYHYLYKITNTITGKYYVGMHTTNNLEDGYFGSGKILKRSINKYGIEAHNKEILEFFKDRDSLVEAEKSILTEDFILAPLCMNIRLGGEGGGGWTTKQQRDNNRKSMERQRWLQENNPEWSEKKGSRMSEALKQQYASGKRRTTVPNWTGRKHKEESKEKISKAKKGHYTGEDNSSYGKRWYYHPELKKNIKCHPDDVPEGFVKGRRMKF